MSPWTPCFGLTSLAERCFFILMETPNIHRGRGWVEGEGVGGEVLATKAFNVPSPQLHLSRSLAGRWGTSADFTTNFLHSSRFSAFCSMMFYSRPVHSLMLFSHRFLCLFVSLLVLFPVEVLASPDDCVTCPYHFSLRLFTDVPTTRTAYARDNPA